jgi:hypothetical protein
VSGRWFALTLWRYDAEGEPIQVEVEGRVIPSRPARGPSASDPGSPEEGPVISELRAYVDGVETTLTLDEEREVEDRAEGEVPEDYDDED